MKRLAITLAVTTTLAAAASDIYSGGLHFALDPTTLTATVIADVHDGINRYAGDIIVPDAVFHDGDNYSITAVGDGAFAGSAVTLIQLPPSVTAVGDRAFDGATALEGITFPLHLEYLGERALAGTAVVAVALPEGLTRVGDEAFARCTALHTLLLPSTVTTLGRGTFNGCYNLFEIYSAGATPPSLDGIDDLSGVDVIVPDTDAVAAYEQDSVWGEYKSFSLWAHDEDSYYDIAIGDGDEEHDMHGLSLAGNVAFTIKDKWGEVVAITAAPRFYLPTVAIDEQYTIVSNVMFADIDEVEHIVPALAPATVTGDEIYPLAAPEVYSMDGTIYINNLQHEGWVRIYDVYGTLHLERPAAQVMNIGNLPSSRVYIIVIGDHATKVAL